MQIDADGRHEKAARPTECRRKHRAARPTLFDPAAEDCGRYAEKKDRQTEDPAELSQLPVPGRRLRDADELGHWQIEYAEGIGFPDTEMDAERGRRNEPAAIARRCNRARSVE